MDRAASLVDLADSVLSAGPLVEVTEAEVPILLAMVAILRPVLLTEGRREPGTSSEDGRLVTFLVARLPMPVRLLDHKQAWWRGDALLPRTAPTGSRIVPLRRATFVREPVGMVGSIPYRVEDTLRYAETLLAGPAPDGALARTIRAIALVTLDAARPLAVTARDAHSLSWPVEQVGGTVVRTYAGTPEAQEAAFVTELPRAQRRGWHPVRLERLPKAIRVTYRSRSDEPSDTAPRRTRDEAT